MSITRVAGLFLVLLCATSGATPSEAAGLLIFSTTGTEADPLTSPFPLSLHPTETKVVGVSLSTGQGTGFVLPVVTCCVDVLTGVQVNPPGLSMSFPPPFLGRRGQLWPGVLVTPTQTPLASLVVTATGSARPGQYTAKLSAAGAGMGASEQAIFVNVLGPTPADDTVTPCASQINNIVVGSGTPPVAEVLPLMGAVDSVFSAKTASPGRTAFFIGAKTKDGGNGWVLELTREDPIPAVLLRPDQTVIVFENETNGDKDLWTVNSAACTGATQHIHAARGGRGLIRISMADVTSLSLRRDVCATWFIVCWATRSDPVAVFTEPPFWSLVGGRVTTIRWTFSNN
jgi:hypothetical protein